MASEGYKCCTKCGETKRLAEFWYDRIPEDGFSRSCRTCVRSPEKQRSKERRAYKSGANATTRRSEHVSFSTMRSAMAECKSPKTAKTVALILGSQPFKATTRITRSP